MIVSLTVKPPLEVWSLSLLMTDLRSENTYNAENKKLKLIAKHIFHPDKILYPKTNLKKVNQV